MPSTSGSGDANIENLVFLVGDKDRCILSSLLGAGNDLTGGEGTSRFIVPLSTKYYSCNLDLRGFKDLEEAREWCAHADVGAIGAVICNFSEEVGSLLEIKDTLTKWAAETQIIVCDRLEDEALWTNELKKFCIAEGIELVELNPSQETVDELREYSEIYGVPRIRQVLETTSWALTAGESSSTRSRHCEETDSAGDLEGIAACYSTVMAGVLAKNEPSLKQSNSLQGAEASSGFGGREEEEFGEFKCGVSDDKATKAENAHTVVNALEAEGECKSGQAAVDEEEAAESSVGTCSMETVKRCIDELVEGDQSLEGVVNQFGAFRTQLSQMPFGPERQKFAADAMMQMIGMLGDDVLRDSSEEED